VKYQITGAEAEARSLAETARVGAKCGVSPLNWCPTGDIRDHIMGQLEAFEQAGERRYLATISFAVEIAGAELTQVAQSHLGHRQLFPLVFVWNASNCR